MLLVLSLVFSLFLMKDLPTEVLENLSELENS